MNQKLKLKPLSKTPPTTLPSEQRIQEFIAAAEDPSLSGSSNIISKNKPHTYEFPWENPLIREDLKKTFNLRLNEKDFVKLEYLAKLKKESMHKTCMDILIPEINKQLNQKII